MTENRPSKFPTAWPTDGRSRMTNSFAGWVLVHPERAPHVWDGQKWEELRDPQEQVA